MARPEGGFEPAIEYTMGTDHNFLQVVDLNGDGHSDVVTDGMGDAGIYVRLSLGDGLFGPALVHSFEHNLRGLDTGDFNEDGVPDVVARGWTEQQGDDDLIVICLGVGVGSVDVEDLLELLAHWGDCH